MPVVVFRISNKNVSGCNLGLWTIEGTSNSHHLPVVIVATYLFTQGYMCHECKWGYYGPNCTQRRTLVRQNLFSLPKWEQKRFVNLIQEAKTAPTEFMAIKADDMDPLSNFTFVNMTMYDYFIFHHFYSARNSFTHNVTAPCEQSPFHLDFSHEGSGFPTWHRLFIMFWEREFQKLAQDDTFTFPYWDWVGAGKDCEVCTNELLGAINYSDPHGRIHRASPFSDWHAICAATEPIKNGEGCRFCDPEEKTGYIVRRGGTNPRANEFPDFEHVKAILEMTDWDTVPFDEMAGNKSFRNCFEGNCPRKGFDYSIHNLVSRTMISAWRVQIEDSGNPGPEISQTIGRGAHTVLQCPKQISLGQEVLVPPPRASLHPALHCTAQSPPNVEALRMHEIQHNSAERFLCVSVDKVCWIWLKMEGVSKICHKQLQ